MFLDVNSKGCKVAEHIATKVMVNPRILSTLKKEKSIQSIKTGVNFETVVVGPLVIVVALVKRQIVNDYSKSGRFLGDLP